MSKPILIKLDRIVNAFDVRTALDDDRVLQFAELYEANADVPPIEVIKTGENNYAFLDGRNRAAGRALCGFTDVLAVVRTDLGNKPSGVLYATALKANFGGSKPPTRADIQHTINRMVEAGESGPAIVRLLDYLPSSIIRKCVDTCKGNIHKKKIQEAIEAVSKGSTVDAAAKKFGLDRVKVSNAISGKKNKWSTAEGSVLTEGKHLITRYTRPGNYAIGRWIGERMQRAEDGELSPVTVQKLLKSWMSAVKGTEHRIIDWQHRLDNIIGNGSKQEEE
jgi:hypothetical protein